MKKRILALALAGTTAFSVFGAAISANAAEIPSAHWVSTNDVYKSYDPAVAIDSSYTAEASTPNYTEITDTYYVRTWKNKELWTSIGGTSAAAVEAEDDVDAKTVVEIEKQKSDYKLWIDTKTQKLYVYYLDKDLVAKYLPADEPVYIDGVPYEVDRTTGETGYTVTKATKYLDALYVGTAKPDDYKLLTAKEAANVAISQLTEITGTYYKSQKENDTKWYYVSANADELKLLKKAQQTTKQVESSALETVTPSDYNVQIVSKLGVSYGDANWTFDSSTSDDTVVYPWTVETQYVVGSEGTIVVNEAVADPTVYLFDFLPYNSVTTTSATVASKYNALIAAQNAYNDNPTDKNEKALADAKEALNKVMGDSEWTAETGEGTSYGIRAGVVDQYEAFLTELLLAGDYKLKKNAFKSEYADLYVSGYLYDKFTGLPTDKTWTTDLYNLDELLNDIYDSSVNNEYLNMNTSEMMYLMQQYNKYVGYIEKEEVSNDDWGDLLVSILESASADDFNTVASYNAYARKAEEAIDNYQYALSSTQVKAAEAQMYSLIASAFSSAKGASEAKADLDATVGGLFFNVKNTPAEYTTDGIAAGNAALTNYAYVGAVRIDRAPVATDEITLIKSSKTTNGYYAMYPAADYKGTEVAAQYPGNNKDDASYGVKVTDEYEWFLNVYELATSAAASNVNGVVGAVNDALVAAIDALEVTVPASASATTALDEMIADAADTLDSYVVGNGVNAEDFNETYYNAYTKALEIAETAEGAAQVANARYMVGIAAGALTYQGAQITVTKNDMKTVETAIADGKAALEAIKNSADYNAAQVTALNKAIAQAQDIVDIYNGKVAGYNKVNYATIASVGDKDGIVKSDITGAIEAIDAAINYSEIVMGWSKNEAGKWMYGTEEGYLSNGWNKIGSTWYYFNADGTAKQSEWLLENGTYYYLNSNCGAAYGWAKVDGKWYYFAGNNAMKTGWVKVDGNWYYLASSGAMVTGWCEVNGKWYYFSKESNSLGQMLYNTTVDGYKLDANGVWVK